MPLFSKHSLGVQTIYSDLKRRAAEQPFLLVGTPGSVGQREVHGQPFLYRQFYDPGGAKRADYIGPAGDAVAQQRAAAIREAIEVSNGLLLDARLLAREGYVRVDSRVNAVVASLANHALFRAGAVLVGSHAYGSLLNELGIKSGAHLTEDIDVARLHRLKLGVDQVSFAKMLEESTVSLSPVPGLDRKDHPTSFKAPGRDRLRVDLLVPAAGREVKVLPVPELEAYATALPHLDYVLTDPIDAIVLGRESVVPVKVPRPERMALHKLYVSQVRTSTSEKRTKDIQQAAVLVAVLAEADPGALEDALASFPRSARAKLQRGAKLALEVLETAGHERGLEALQGVVG